MRYKNFKDLTLILLHLADPACYWCLLFSPDFSML